MMVMTFPAHMLAAYLWAQLQEADRINDDRRATWDAYYQAFLPLSEKGLLGIPTVPEGCVHNAHLFYVKLADLAERTAFMDAVSSEVSALGASTLQDVQVGTNTVSGSISVDAEKMLFLSIPWSQGWSATVDGEPVDLLQADTAFMWLDL